jgi:hypothetical protein
MSRRVSPSTDRAYGLQRVARVWGASRATVYRHRCRSDDTPPRRSGPVGAMADEALVEAIRKLLTDSPFHGEGLASSGRGYASRASAPAVAASCGSRASTACWPINAPAGPMARRRTTA